MQERRIFFTDIIIEAAIPVLIIGLMWSLVVFTITINGVFNPGGEGTLMFVFFLYVTGSVMINRIAGYYGESGKAAAYSIALILPMAWFALQYSGSFGYILGGKGADGGALANVALVIVIGLASYKIARESCLDIADPVVKEKSVIQLRSEQKAQRDWYVREQMAEQQEAEKLEREKKEAAQGSREIPDSPPKVSKKHPAAWTIYFSLFSMVVFAAGQRLLPEDDGRLYAYTFACLAANLICALALLMLISLSSIRRQCWEKKALVTPGVGWFWIFAGAALILVVVSLAMLAPRPVPDYLVRSATPTELPRLEEEVEEEAKGGSKAQTTWAGLRKQRELEAAREEREFQKLKDQMEGRDDESEGGGDEDAPEGNGRGSGGDQAGNSSKGKTADGKGGSGQEPGRKRGTDAGTIRAPLPTPPLAGLATLGKIIAIIIMALLAIWAIVFAFDALGKANPFKKFSALLKSFRERMRNLRGRKKRKPLRGEKLKVALKEQGIYMENPFRNRALLSGMSKAELVNYTYKAFENYSHTQGHTPSKDQTPAEFLKSMPKELAATEFSSLVGLFMLSEYSTREITDKNLEQLQETWQIIEGGEPPQA